MPNYVANVVKMKGIAELPLFTEQDGKNYFDFNKIIPMPESLDVESGSRTEMAVVYFLTDHCAIPIRCLNPDDKEIADALVENMFSKNWLQEVYNRTQEWAYKTTATEKDKMFAMGQIYIDNYKKYGAATWYKWCVDNWGTKWNALGGNKVDNDTVSFKTAWSAPLPIMEKLSEMYPDQDIVIKWADEDKGSNTGEVVYRNGAVIRGGANDNGTKAAYAAYSDCWSQV